MSSTASAVFARGAGDPLNRYYTRSSVGQLLVKLVEPLEPTKIVDLGAGEGSLTSAAIRRWPAATAVTVDLDPHCIDPLLGALFRLTASEHFHHVRNALDPDLPLCLARYGQFDLAVCNPPFEKIPWNRGFSTIFRDADMEDALSSTADLTAELAFFAQNVRLVRSGGIIAFIAPDSLATGWRTRAFRTHLLRHHRVQCIVQLPHHSFHDTEARCFVLVVRNRAQPRNQVRLLRYSKSEGLSDSIEVDAEAAELRMDYDFHALRGAANGRTLGSLGADVRRGSIGTVESRAAPYPVFHTSDFKRATAGELILSDAGFRQADRLVVAEPGDILMARVDRSLHEKVALVVQGRAVITDCVLRVRIAPEHQRKVFDALISPFGREMLKSVTKGVSARLLGKADLLSLPLGIA